MKLSLAAAAIALAIPATVLAAEGRDKPSFPMAGEAFLDMVEQRLDRMEERIDARLDKSDKSDADKEKIRKRFDKHSAALLAAAKAAAADGTVTAEEAKAMRKRHKKGKAKAKRGKGQRNKS